MGVHIVFFFSFWKLGEEWEVQADESLSSCLGLDLVL